MNEKPSDSDPAYHPAVERLVETTGPDIGRISDPNVAHDFATSAGTPDQNARAAVQRSAVQHGDPNPHLAESSYDDLQAAAHVAHIERAKRTFHAVDVPDPVEVSSAERTELDEVEGDFIVHARGYMTDDEKDALEVPPDNTGRFNFALARVLEALDTDPTAPIRDDLNDVIATRYATSPQDRFLRSPLDNGILLNDTAGDLVSMQGAQVVSIAEGLPGAGSQYVKDYVAVSVLTGPNKGQAFAFGTYPAVVPERTQAA